MHVFISVCTCIHGFISDCTCMYSLLHVHACNHFCMYMHVFISVHTCMYSLLCVACYRFRTFLGALSHPRQQLHASPLRMKIQLKSVPTPLPRSLPFRKSRGLTAVISPFIFRLTDFMESFSPTPFEQKRDLHNETFLEKGFGY